MDLEVVMNSSECPYIVKFYGALFTEVCRQLAYCSLVVPYPGIDLLGEGARVCTAPPKGSANFGINSNFAELQMEIRTPIVNIMLHLCPETYMRL